MCQTFMSVYNKVQIYNYTVPVCSNITYVPAKINHACMYSCTKITCSFEIFALIAIGTNFAEFNGESL